MKVDCIEYFRIGLFHSILYILVNIYTIQLGEQTLLGCFCTHWNLFISLEVF